MTDDLKTRRAINGYHSQSACNPGALARSLVRYLDQEPENQNEIFKDPGVRLLVYQLAYLALGPAVDYPKWREDFKHCEEIYKQTLPDLKFYVIFEHEELKNKYFVITAKTKDDATDALNKIYNRIDYAIFSERHFEDVRCAWHKEVTLEEINATV